ncbi:hypothetical protein [Thermocatellispora tengchongensis]|uniref:hypothetical protein n=1 Tax=Thermocatellispora tengchongensis TaxID=1073253 RepID=UPI0031E70220
MSGNVRFSPLTLLTRRWATLAAIATTAAVALAAPWLPETFAAWGLFSAALIYVAWGSVRAARGRPGRIALNLAGLVLFTVIAIVSVELGGDAGRYLLAAGWLGHAVWDWVHHRANQVVPRPYAEWCGVVDVLTAGAVLFLP